MRIASQLRLLITALAAGSFGLFAPAAEAAGKKANADVRRSVARPVVTFSDQYDLGTIIVVNKERKLYYVHEKGKAIVYPVAIGVKKEQWTGKLFVQSKAVNPSWTKPETGVRMAGGPGNPLGARALYLGWTLYRIHGTNSPGSIGSAASNGCFRMHNEHVKDLYARVHVGAPVYVFETLAEASQKAS